MARYLAVCLLAACGDTVPDTADGGADAMVDAPPLVTPDAALPDAPPATFTVHGTVVSLGADRTVVVQLDGGESVARSSNGAFAFTTPVLAGAPYSIAIQTQPSDQTCAIHGGAGIVGGDVTVTILCRAWVTEGVLESEAGVTNVQQLQAIVDGSGNLTTVWMQHDGAQRNLWARSFAAGIWHPAEKIEALDVRSVDDVSRPVVDQAGQVTVVWSHNDEGNSKNSLWRNRLGADGWSGATTVEGKAGNVHAEPRAAVVDGDGVVTVTWRQFDGKNQSIYAVRGDAAGWGEVEPLELDSGDAEGSTLAVDADGNVLVVWPHELSPGVVTLRGNRFDRANGTWGLATTIDTETATGTEDFAVVADDTGTFTVVWTCYHDAGLDLRAVRVGSDLTQATSAYLETADASVAEEAAVVVAADGVVTVAWLQGDAVWANRHMTVWTGAERLDVMDGWRASRLSEQPLAVTPSGEVVAVWAQRFGDEGRWALVGARHTGDAWTAASILDGSEAEAVVSLEPELGAPAVVADADDVASVVWCERDEGFWAVRSLHHVSGDWSGPHMVTFAKAQMLSGPRLAVDPAGTVWAFWNRSSGELVATLAGRWFPAPTASQ